MAFGGKGESAKSAPGYLEYILKQNLPTSYAKLLFDEKGEFCSTKTDKNSANENQKTDKAINNTIKEMSEGGNYNIIWKNEISKEDGVNLNDTFKVVSSKEKKRARKSREQSWTKFRCLPCRKKLVEKDQRRAVGVN